MTGAWNSARLVPVAIAALAAAVAGSSCTGRGQPGDCVNVGVVTSYTGPQAATGFNIERALRLAERQINGSGGLAGKRLCLRYVDTHSELARGEQAVNELLDSHSLVALIGPEDLALALALRPAIEQHQVLHLLPGTTTSTLIDSTNGLWLRLGPPAEGLGCVLGETIYDTGRRNIAVLHSPDVLTDILAESIPSRIASYQRPLSPATVTLFDVQEGQSSYATLGQTVVNSRPDAVVVLTSAQTATRLFQDWPQGATNPGWFLGPGLLNKSLLDNAPPGFLERALGMGPSYENRRDAEALSQEFQQSFGDRPFTIGFYYYDALALVALATEAASVKAGGVPDSLQVITELRGVSTSPGARVSWQTLGQGLEKIRAREDVDYNGISGPLTMDANGIVDRSSMVYVVEQVLDGQTTMSHWDACSF